MAELILLSNLNGAGDSTIAPLIEDPDSETRAALDGVVAAAPFVKTVNDVTPDGDGNVVVSGGGGGVGDIGACVEVEDTGYPSRPDAPLVIWRGWTDPTADPDFQTGIDLWAEADAPVAPAATWFTDFSTDTAGSPPAGWTSRWNAFTSTNVVTDGSAKILRIIKSSGVTRGFLSWDTIPDSADVEIVAKYRISTSILTPASTVQRDMIAVRATGTSSALANAYIAELTAATGEAKPNGRPYKALAAGGSNWVVSSGTDLPDYADTTWNWMRLRANGGTVSAKFWPDGSTEPASWTVTGADSAIPGAGKVGVVLYVTGTQDYACVGVGIDGATAPKSA